MNKPQRPFIEGNEPQLIEKTIGKFIQDPYNCPVPKINLDLKLNINIDWPDNNDTDSLKKLSQCYNQLDEALRELGYSRISWERSEEGSYIYAYRNETPEEVAARISYESKLEKEYESQLIVYKAWLMKELDNFNK